VYRLRAAAGDDAEITLLDPADRLGGALRTEHVGGRPMDVGAEAFVVRRPEALALLDELGLAERRISTTGARPLIYSQGRLHALPARTVVGIPSSAESVAGLVDDTTIARIRDEPARPLHWRVGGDPPVAQLVAERFGEQVVARSVDPLLGGVYAGSAATIGVRAAAPGLAAALDGGAASLTEAVHAALSTVTDGPVFGALQGGYRVLVDELVRRGRPRWVRSGVERIERTEQGWTVRDSAGTRRHADAVILAVPAPHSARLLDGFAPHAAAAARRIRSATSAVVAFAVPAGAAFPEHSGVLAASGEPLQAKAITLSSRKWGGHGDVELVRLSFGRFGDDALRCASDDQLLAWAVDDLATVFGVAVTPVEARVQRWSDAMPQYGPGHGELVAELRAGLPATVSVAGSYLDGIGVPACIGAAGRAAADVIRAAQDAVAR
jgi:oxygen-dependent protoporphyrinogen oxidase